MTAVSLYLGEVSHWRFGNAVHRLRYRLAYVLADLDRLDEANARSRLLGVGRPRLLSVEARDHGDGRQTGLADWVRGHLADCDVQEPCTTIQLLTLPRMFGYVFNPISVYFIYGNGENPHHILYEVNNTFGDRHYYLAKIDADSPATPHRLKKELYVSPFFDVEGQYRFTVEPPGEGLLLEILYYDGAGAKALMATLRGKRQAVTDWQCLKIIIAFPLMTFGVMAAIHWEALKLFLKGARYRSPPRRAGAKARAIPVMAKPQDGAS